MSVVIIRECGDKTVPDAFVLDMSKIDIKDCTGCWTCWWGTPGICVHKDLDDFYRAYLNADKAIFFSKVTKGFVSGNLKSLFDRLIPHYMPYTSISTGESMHLTRYDKYPDIEFYYEGEFTSENSKKIFEDYVYRVFYQFHNKNILIKPISKYKDLGVTN